MKKKPLFYGQFAAELDRMVSFIEKTKRPLADKVDHDAEKTLSLMEEYWVEFRKLLEETYQNAPLKTNLTKREQRFQDNLEGLKKELLKQKYALQQALKIVKKEDSSSKHQKGRRKKKFKRAGGRGGWLKS